jgi:hypothetical protein
MTQSKNFFLTYSTGFVYLPSKPEGSKKTYFGLKNVTCLFFYVLLLQSDFAAVNIERIEREIRVCPRVQCPLFLSDFNKKWKTLTKLSRTPLGQR